MIRCAAVWMAFCEDCPAALPGPPPTSPDTTGSLPGLYDRLGAEGWRADRLGERIWCSTCVPLAPNAVEIPAPPTEGRVPVFLTEPPRRRVVPAPLSWIGGTVGGTR